MTSYSVYYYTQGPTPTQWANGYTNGPSGALFNCYPSPTRTITDTFEWIATGTGCPIGYELSSAPTFSTCFWTGILVTPQAFTWECLFTVGTTAIHTVDGGTTTVAKGNAVTVTGNPQTITVTQTVQQTSTATSIVAPGANTVSVTSTVTQDGALVKKQLPRIAEPEENQAVLNEIFYGTDLEYSYLNSTNPLIPRVVCDVPCSDYCCKHISNTTRGILHGN
jgi:hypothetical protein